ncbi:uncharacterized protein EAE97_005389 [Botrytis byssoidea]|uniref:Uncharacterized protein n=1 Tax=Botrytis byssoidea TaxID=139641 RepID=A0A9P5IRV5_9HELO|nr:uncharacterized protein EAE97_005389 [Botrytis byssoidea]KAF7944756.1 hypothetical protein EAE97_005389 [Botrytis byssoidea]
MGLTEEERKKARRDAQGRTISGPIDVIASTTLREGSGSYIRDTNDPTQQPPRYPNASLIYTGHSSTPGQSNGHGNPNLAPQGSSRSVPDNTHQLNQAPAQPARYQQPPMHTSSPGQFIDTRRPRSRDRSSSAQRNSGNRSQSRPSSSHSNASSVDNGTTTTSQRGSRGSRHSHHSHGSRDSTDSHSSTASSLDRDPFEYDSPKYRKLLKKG